MLTLRKIILPVGSWLCFAFAMPTFAQTPLDALKLKPSDEQGNDVRALKTEMLVTDTENKALAQLQMLIKKYKGSPMEPDLRLRLAELYMRRSKTDRFFELNRTSPTLVRFIPPEAKTSSGKKSIELAVSVYEKLAKDYPQYSKLDLVLYNTAFAHQQLVHPKIAERVYSELIAKFPYSPLIPEAHLALGEMQFDHQKFAEALTHFDAIKNYPQSDVYPYGIYKGAWTLYNLKRNDEAIKQLEMVVSIGKQAAEQGQETRLDLRKEALADMVIFYEDSLPASRAFAFFNEQSSAQEAPALLLKLAEVFERHSRYEDRKTVLVEFIDKLRGHELIPEAYDQLVRNYEGMRDRKGAVEALVAFEGVCQRKPWPKCSATISETALALSSKWLRTWKKNQSFVEFADAAQKGFEIYLRQSLPSHDKDEARYAYAELLFQRHQYREASAQYALVAPALIKEPSGHDAAYGALLSLEKAVSDKWSAADEKQFKSLASFYVEHFPKGQYRLDVEFKIAIIAYDKERYDEAAPIFLKLGNDFPNQEKGLKSQDLYLDILNIKKDFKNLKQYSVTLLKRKPNLDRTIKLQKIYRESYFIEIQKTEEAGDLPLATSEFKKFAKDNINSDLAPKAWWNAMQIEYRSFKYMSAAQSGEAFYDQFPKNSQALEALLKSAQTYESMGQLDAAARVVLKLAIVDPKNVLKWRTLGADFLALSHHSTDAMRIYSELKDQRTDMKTASYALDKYLALQKTSLQDSDYVALLERVARGGVQPQASFARVELVERMFKAGDVNGAFAKAKDVLNMGDSAPAAAKARARFVQAQILEMEFAKASMKARTDRLALVVALKTEKLEKAQAAYKAVISYGDPQLTIQSLRHLANCYTQYVQALKTMPSPEGLSTAEEKQFHEELTKLAIPLEEKGVDTIAQALETAKKMKLFDGSVASLQAQLDQMNLKQTTTMKVEFQPPATVLPKATGVGS